MNSQRVFCSRKIDLKLIFLVGILNIFLVFYALNFINLSKAKTIKVP